MEKISFAKEMQCVAIAAQTKEATKRAAELVASIRSDIKKAAFAGRMTITVSVVTYTSAAVELAAHILRTDDGFLVKTAQVSAPSDDGTDPGLQISWDKI